MNPNQLRDYDGDGYEDGVLFGPVDPFVASGWPGAPYYLGVGHRGSDPSDGFVSIDRWNVGNYSLGDRVTGVLIDPWRTETGTCGLVVVKDITTGACTLREVSRGAVAGSFAEIWPDRAEAVPCTLYSTSTTESLSLSALHPTRHVSGGYIDEAEIEGVTCTVLHLSVVADQECDLDDSDELTGHITLARYVVTKSGEGHLVLTELVAD